MVQGQVASDHCCFVILSRPGRSVRFRGDQRSGTINSILLTPGYLLAPLRELSHVPRGLTDNAEAKQVRKTNQTILCTRSEKWSENQSSRFQRLICFRGVRSTLSKLREVEDFAIIGTPVPKKYYHLLGLSQMWPYDLWTCPDHRAARAQTPGCQRSSYGSVRRGRGEGWCSQQRS